MTDEELTEEFIKNPNGAIRKVAQESVQQQVRQMQQQYDMQKGAERLIADLKASNPQFTEKTVVVARAILETHPKLNTITNAYDVLIPFVFAIAHEIEEEIDKRMPEEWK